MPIIDSFTRCLYSRRMIRTGSSVLTAPVKHANAASAPKASATTSAGFPCFKPAYTAAPPTATVDAAAPGLVTNS